jgi:hypothetical protein
MEPDSYRRRSGECGGPAGRLLPRWPLGNDGGRGSDHGHDAHKAHVAREHGQRWQRCRPGTLGIRTAWIRRGAGVMVVRMAAHVGCHGTRITEHQPDSGLGRARHEADRYQRTHREQQREDRDASPEGTWAERTYRVDHDPKCEGSPQPFTSGADLGNPVFDPWSLRGEHRRQRRRLAAAAPANTGARPEAGQVGHVSPRESRA